MIPTLAIPNSVIPLPTQVEAIVGVPTETSMSARLPFHAVPASVSAVQVYNNGRGTAAYAPPTRPSVTPPVPTFLSFPPYHAAGAGVYVGTAFTSVFMTQVMGQQTPATREDNQLISQFFSAPMQGPAPAEEQVLDPYAVRTKDNVAVPDLSVRPSAKAAPATMPLQQISGGLAVAAQLSQAAGAAVPAMRAESGAAFRMSPSLIRPRGVDGYLATFSRNLSLLAVPSQGAALKIL